MRDVLPERADKSPLLRAAAGVLGAYGIAILVLGGLAGLAYIQAAGTSGPALLAAAGITMFASALALPAIVLAGLVKLHMDTQSQLRELRSAVERLPKQMTTSSPRRAAFTLPLRALPAASRRAS